MASVTYQPPALGIVAILLPGLTVPVRLPAGGLQMPSPVRAGVTVTQPLPTPPLLLTSPVITAASLYTGGVLTTTNGTWANGTTSFAYQWKRAGATISGATSSTYTTVTADNGKAVTCVVTATNDSGTSSPAGSNALSIIALVPVKTATPTVSASTVLVGNAVTCGTGSWANTPTSYTYQWQRDGVPISGATTNSHTAVTADVNHSLTCVVTAINANGSSAPATSTAAVCGAANLPAFTTNPTLAFSGAWTTDGDSVTFPDMPNDTTNYYWSLSFQYHGSPVSLTMSNDPSSSPDVTVSSGSPGSSVASAVATFLGYGTITGATLQLASQNPTDIASINGSFGALGVIYTQGVITGAPTATVTGGTVVGTPTPSITWAWLVTGLGGSGSDGYSIGVSSSTTALNLMTPFPTSTYLNRVLYAIQTATNSHGQTSANTTIDPANLIAINP